MHPLPANTTLGHLRIVEVFDFYDGPRLFSARNSVGTTYVAYWADEVQQEDIWLYVPVSHQRLQSVRSGSVSLREVFLAPEDGTVFEVSTPKNRGAASVKQLAPSEIDSERLPPVDDRLSGDSIADQAVPSAATNGARLPSDYVQQSLSVSTWRSRKAPLIAAVTAIWEKWSDLLATVALRLGQEIDFFPLKAREGSFVVDIAVSDSDATRAAFLALKNLIELGANLTQSVFKNLGIDPSKLEALLASIREHSVEVRVSMQDDSEMLCIVLSPEDAALRIDSVSEAARGTLGTDQVPQADDIHRVLKLVQLAVAHAEISGESLEITPRQVNYYKQAARLLGFLDEQNTPTAVAYRLASRATDERLLLTAVQFEGSRCGWAWVQWSQATSLRDVDPSTAETFLISVAPDLSESTARRRAKTLRSWWAALTPYHYTHWSRPQNSR